MSGNMRLCRGIGFLKPLRGHDLFEFRRGGGGGRTLKACKGEGLEGGLRRGFKGNLRSGAPKPSQQASRGA